MKIYAAIDIGGTSIKYGIVDESGNVQKYSHMPTDANNGQKALIEKIYGIVQNLMKDYPDIKGLGISTAGIVDTQIGKVIYANDLMPGYTGTAWKQLLESRYSIKVIVNNDVNSAALAEAWVGAARGCDNFFCLTIGTGVGGAAFLNGKLFTGTHYRAAEIGYMMTGGCNALRFDKTASTTALVSAASGKTNESGLDGKILFEKARANDPKYKEVFEKWFDNLANGICNVVCIYDPSLIVIGGGISAEGEFLIDNIKRHLQKYLAKALLDGIEFKTASCKNQAGMIGAVYEFTKL